ncbi:synaptotagmin-like protein 3 [Tiliqua scincoides]|uniref:synaptotagmin-like protein 3 n=1 Tax=Tiliqua scincoides TaxID=71010 RepID=UPI0034625307
MSQEFNLSFLKGLEREIVLKVLHRDQMLRMVDEERIGKLKVQLYQLRWKGAKSGNHEYRERSCARCWKSLGVLLNRGAVCHGCSHQVCSDCRIMLNPCLWRCTVCYANADVKVKAGEWFFEERAKKFPNEGGCETAGAKLLESYQDLSDISVVPPTPSPTGGRDGAQTTEFGTVKGFHRSFENIFLSFATHIKNFSKSQNDVTEDNSLLTADYGQELERRSQSDTAINITSKVKNTSSLHRLISGEQNSIGIASRSDSSEEVILSNPISDTFSASIRHGSSCSIDSTCTETGDFEIADVSGEIELAIRYRFKFSTLEVCINACKNLAYGEEKKKKSNPYVKTRLLPDKSFQNKQKTSVRKNTVDPEFQETLKYKTEYSQLETQQLHVSVWHCGTFRRRVFLGEVIISFECWDFEDNSTQSFCWYQLKAKAEKSEEDTIPHNGELLVRAKLVSPSLCNRFQYEEQMKEKTKPSIHTHLCLLLLGANNLPTIRPNGQLNSFVKSCLCIRGQRDLKQRTPVLKKQTQPQWKHLFVFNGVTTTQLQQSCLDLTVWDQSLFGLRDQFLGGARLGTKTPTSTPDATPQASLQWEKMLSSPDTWTDIMLMLYPNAQAFKF